MLKETDILYQNGDYWICKYFRGKEHIGFEIYKNGITHSTRCAIIGLGENYGLKRAIKECDRRANESKGAACGN